jgi:hypothetical protein
MVVLAGFVFLNLRNQCQPGWCGDYGWPMVYRHWSDVIPEINGVIYGPWFSVRALAFDIAIGALGVVASVVLSRRFWSGSARAAA